MFSLKEMGMTQAASTMFSAYASLAALMMFVRSVMNELSGLIPDSLRTYISDLLENIFKTPSENLTILIDENTGMGGNQIFQASQVYLRTKVNIPSTQRLRVSKTERQKIITVAIDKNEEIIDSFDNVELKWRFICIETKNDSHPTKKEYHFELTFHKRFKEKVLDSYLPFILAKAKEIKEKEKVVKIHSRDCPFYEDGGGVYLEHPSTFDTLAMDPELKKFIIDDLDRFVRRREFYKRVGKAWKRGYLLYGPPGTGKSSMVAAMANYLKFDIYDLDLNSMHSNYDLRREMLSTSNRSIVVIEDIDCSPLTHNRDEDDQSNSANTQMTLSALLNFIDGLWSSFGDERIIVFTTNHKERLDPALLRPGRMDVHINMSYCTVQGFKFLVSSYHGLKENCKSQFYEEAGRLIETTQATPAEVAGELMRSEDAEVALELLVNFLKRKKDEQEAASNEESEDSVQNEDETDGSDGDNEKIQVVDNENEGVAAKSQELEDKTK